jgi:N-acetyl-anhydromuramyl-L-alanine amidase AmpD
MGCVTRVLPHKFKLPALGTPRVITIHCTATPEGKHFSAEQIVAMDVQTYHQPSYHYVVELDGSIVKCLTLTEKGAHVRNHNTSNIGIGYVGGVDVPGKKGKPKDTRTPEQKAALRALVAELRRGYKTITTVKGHRDWSPDLDHDGVIEPHEWMKVCPCFDVATQL